MNANKLSKSMIINNFDLSVTNNKMVPFIWYSHKYFRSLLIMKTSTTEDKFILATLDNVSAVVSPSHYDPHNINAIMEGKAQYGSLEDVYAGYMDRLAKDLFDDYDNSSMTNNDTMKEYFDEWNEASE